MKVGFIGAGNMAGAIIGGVLRSKLLPPSEIAVFDVNAEKLESCRKQGMTVLASPEEVAASCKYVLLAIKPQNFADVMAQIAPSLTEESVVISIVAGVSAAYIKESAGFDVKVVPVMPNTPLLIGHGTVAMSHVQPTSDEEFVFAQGLFAAAGQVTVIPPDKMNEVIPLNGSSPAFIYLIAKLFVDEAEKNGFDRETANRLFCDTLIGSAHMMLDTGMDHQTLINMVCSPGGTTLKGLEALKEYGIEEAIAQCSRATIKRSYELGK